MKQKPFVVVVGMLVAGVIVYAGVHVLAKEFLLSNTEISISPCNKNTVTHFVNIEGGVATPAEVTGNICDKLTIINHDNRIRLMAFGVHEKHLTYDGVVQKALAKGQNLTITLTQAGTYKYHDHLDDSSQGTFTVR